MSGSDGPPTGSVDDVVAEVAGGEVSDAGGFGPADGAGVAVPVEVAVADTDVGDEERVDAELQATTRIAITDIAAMCTPWRRLTVASPTLHIDRAVPQIVGAEPTPCGPRSRRGCGRDHLGTEQ